LHPASISASIRRALARWFDANQRDLPWRRTRDPYAIWISEIMLQQTRVAAVIPYYERFLSRFPTPQALAEAPETEVLTMWAGLGYYSRARNLQKAAQLITAMGGFPRDYETIRVLPGIGDYTAAAVASIAFGLPYSSIDGNVRRVVTRLSGDPQAVIADEAAALLDRQNPGRSNQALMELGATICIPREPKCEACPVKQYCSGFNLGIQNQLPLAKVKSASVKKDRTLLVIRDRGRILLVPSPRVQGFWELPEPFEGATLGVRLGMFRHAITNSQYSFEVREAHLPQGVAVKRSIASIHPQAHWLTETKLAEIPLSTAAKKALLCLKSLGPL
jgi:A/G-specific adenine glycosylase